MFRILIRLALVLTVATACFSRSAHDFQRGKLLDISTDERIELGTSERWPIFTVQIAGVVYTRGADASTSAAPVIPDAESSLVTPFGLRLKVSN